jgi:hypothetical protein
MSHLTPTAIRKLESLASMRTGDGVNDALLSVADLIRHEVGGPSEAKAIIFPYLQHARQGRSMVEIERELNRQIETAYVGFVRGETVLPITSKPARKQPVINEPLLTIRF